MHVLEIDNLTRAQFLSLISVAHVIYSYVQSFCDMSFAFVLQDLFLYCEFCLCVAGLF